MTCDPGGGLWIDAEVVLCHQPQAAQQPQRVIDEVLLRNGMEMPLMQVPEAVGRIHQGSTWSEGQGDGVEPVVAPLQISIQIDSVPSRQVHRPVPQDEPSHVPRFIQDDTGALQFLGQVACETQGIPWNHQIKVRRRGQPIQEAIPYGTAHKGCSWRELVQWERPIFRS